MTTATIQFLGAAGTVTGSKYLVTVDKTKILIDAGMFQGEREWREKNWEKPVVDMSTIDAALITHAHIDHTGVLPRLVKFGLKCPVYTTDATIDLSAMLLEDSARLQKEEAEWRSAKPGRSRHPNPEPLYSEEDAQAAIKLFKSVSVHKRIEIAPNIFATWNNQGHILGAGSIVLDIKGKRINFSGDIGRYNVPILKDPEGVELGDLLLIESTYGDREHSEVSPKQSLAETINDAVHRGGCVVIPSFAIGRTQDLLFYLRELRKEGKISDIPVYIDSPMAKDATGIYARNGAWFDDESKKLFSAGQSPFMFSNLHFVKSREDSKKLNSIHQPMVIISASGMLTGGRILHHLKNRITDSRNIILFVGFQPHGGTGDWIKQGHSTVRIMGEEVPVNAEIREVSGLSAHAGKSELVRWAKSCTGAPGQVAVVHGEAESAKSFSETLKSDLKWGKVNVPRYLDTWEI